MGVVSTRDKGFPYAPFQARVKNGEVRIERDSGDKVRLVIQRLRAEDQGKYECYTPSTDSTYQGNYSGTVTVKGEVNKLSKCQGCGFSVHLSLTENNVLVCMTALKPVCGSQLQAHWFLLRL